MFPVSHIEMKRGEKNRVDVSRWEGFLLQEETEVAAEFRGKTFGQLVYK